MKIIIVCLIVVLFNGCGNDKYIYKFEGNNNIPTTRVIIETGEVEIYNNEYLIEYETSKFEITKNKLMDDGLKKLNDKELFDKLYSLYYKDVNKNEIEFEVFKKFKLYDLVKKDYRWLNINEYNKQMNLFNSTKDLNF